MRVFGALLRNANHFRAVALQPRTAAIGYTRSMRVGQLECVGLRNRAYTNAPPPPPPPPPSNNNDNKEQTSSNEPLKDQKPASSANSGRIGPTGKPLPKERLLPATGPLSPLGISLFLLTAAGIVYVFTVKKEQVRQERELRKRSIESTGKADVGGPFELIDQDGKTRTEKSFQGRFALIYFGFCHCPDICPDEMDKIGETLELLDRDPKTKDVVQPIFITCDPQRDSPEAIKEYLKQFHPKFVGLTGSIDQVRSACKAYRVYFSKPPKVAENQDYLVDHSIFSYFMDPDGTFVDVYGKDKTALEMASGITNTISKFRAAGRDIDQS
ncbi:Cu-binding protein [Coemansia guatemalensis]|uniref:Cu-binding protein n=1 Tax=Coemansia guatemalensis TaxID=2761395 RepID=A0A9W8HSV3_9FUNG|nr:Cu-binding protein [Coemansia guatemalensis]